jgi:hypothetical protein
MLAREFAVVEDFEKKPRPDVFARVNGNDRAPAIDVPKHMMAAADPQRGKTCAAECGNDLPAT